MAFDAGSDPKFPGSPSGLPPSPTRENPGGVFPYSDPKAAASDRGLGSRTSSRSPSLLGNPFLMNGAFNKLDHALGEVISLIESEEHAVGGSGEESALLHKLRTWRDELDYIRSGGRLPRSASHSRTPERREGGMFTD